MGRALLIETLPTCLGQPFPIPYVELGIVKGRCNNRLAD